LAISTVSSKLLPVHGLGCRNTVLACWPTNPHGPDHLSPADAPITGCTTITVPCNQHQTNETTKPPKMTHPSPALLALRDEKAKRRGSVGDRTRDLAQVLFPSRGSNPEARIIPLDHGATFIGYCSKARPPPYQYWRAGPIHSASSCSTLTTTPTWLSPSVGVFAFLFPFSMPTNNRVLY